MGRGIAIIFNGDVYGAGDAKSTAVKLYDMLRQKISV
jgi:hypothetical protein